MSAEKEFFSLSLECAKVSQIAEVQGERVPGIRTRGTESCTRQRTSKGRLPEEETTLGTQANGSTAGGGRREHGLQIVWRRPINSLMDQAGQFKTYTILHGEPTEVFEKRADATITSGKISNKSSGRVENPLQFVNRTCLANRKKCIAVVQMSKNETMNKSMQIRAINEFPDAVEIAKMQKTFTANLGDMVIERKKAVKSDPEQLDGTRDRQIVITNKDIKKIDISKSMF